jgi:hypothetical protein
VLLLVWLFAQAADLPKFGQFKVSEIYRGKPAAPVLKTAGQRMFRTRIREAAEKGPNFAGHYAVAVWGCGSDCAQLNVIDVQSGEVYPGPFGGLPGGFTFFLGISIETAGFHHQVDSRLLVVNGCPGGENCGTHYFEWTGSGFRLLRRVQEAAGR